MHANCCRSGREKELKIEEERAQVPLTEGKENNTIEHDELTEQLLECSADTLRVIYKVQPVYDLRKYADIVLVSYRQELN